MPAPGNPTVPVISGALTLPSASMLQRVAETLTVAAEDGAARLISLLIAIAGRMV